MDAFSRSKSYTQAASTSTPPPSRSGAVVPGSTVASQQQHVFKNILKSVESHVRIMSAVERTATSSSYTSLRIRQPDRDDAGGSGTASSSQGPQSSQSAGGWSQPFNVTRVHRGGTTARFYEEVVAPCVSNCTSGQSYVFLVNGPPESGRSQTLYGSPHHSELGIVELAAADLLERMASRGKVIMRNHRDRPDATGKENEAVSGTPSSTTANSGREDVSEVATTGGITVTYAAFTTRGGKMLETETSEPVPLVEFPPPLGLVPLPRMRLLEDASKAVLLPERKHVDTSCVIQFHVYAPVDTTGRRSMATLTFVDVAAIREPLCKEVSHLIDTVERVAGVSTSGGDPNFKETKLTTLLEPVLVGYITLVSITTVSGRADLYESTCTALRFASHLCRIHQVLMLIHMNAPRWIFDTAVNLEQLRMRRDQLMAEHYARGVYDCYQRISGWLQANVSDVGSSVDDLLQQTAHLRKDIARTVEDIAKELQSAIEKEGANCRVEVEAARTAYEATSKLFDEVRRLDEVITTQQQKISQTDMQSSQRISEMRLEISALEAKANNRQQQLQQLEKEMKLYLLKGGEVSATLSKAAEGTQYAQISYAMSHELLEIGRKRKRLEADLELASHVAQRTTDTMRVDRERRSRISRLSAVQQRVHFLRDTVCCTASNPTTAPPQNSQQPSRRTFSAGRRSGPTQ
ncbi:hypothetical protein, conserved [Leishmania tarentolae]|uniref:Kinesin motor domain-containing protein n=1 Tax=Leishmania tarentolae TaxID=5689 RepID=A0A640K9Y1_LEITA|nr:hypothetical protein, conserved [Leishmania tarentolae]